MQRRLAMSNTEVKEMMLPLTQTHLETRLLQPRDPEAPLVMIYFTAKWCRPCQNVKLASIYHFRNDIKWYLCDVDDNDYSLGFCGGRQIPSFGAIVQGKQLPLITTADHTVVCKWIAQLPTFPAKPGAVLASSESSQHLIKPQPVPSETAMPPVINPKVALSFSKKK